MKIRKNEEIREELIQDFDWDVYESNSLRPNKKIKTKNSEHIVYSHSPDAQKLYDMMFADGKEITPKDLITEKVYEIKIIGQSSIKGEVEGAIEGNGQSVFINIEKERNFLEKINYDVNDIKEGSTIHAYVFSSKTGLSYSGSIEKGYKLKLKEELFDSINKKKSAYLVKILEVNAGGFIVNLSGLRCFMPGSLSAANKIIDFESMLGKEAYVMVESYLDSSDMFVVSNKKYIKTILPEKVKELSYENRYKGTITGSAPYGCFVEWDEIFTGLIHTSEMDPDLSSKGRKVKAGEEVEFWIKEIKDPNRIILTQRGPDPERVLYKEFKKRWEGEEFGGARVKDIKSFGVFIELEEGIVGMMPPREFKRYKDKISEGDLIDVDIKKVDSGEKKIYLKYLED